VSFANFLTAKRVVLMVEMSDGSRSAWAVYNPTCSIEVEHNEWRTTCATVTATGVFEGLWLPPETYDEAFTTKGEVMPATPELDP
jgi:hypothetical protein